MHLSINKRKIYFYIFSFLFLATISNNKINFAPNELFLVSKIKIETNSIELKKKILSRIGQLRSNNIFFFKR